MKSKRFTVLLALLVFFALVACERKISPTASSTDGLLQEPQQAKATEVETANPQNSEAAETGLPLALVDFRVTIPEETESTDAIYLTVLDEVTGLYLNSQSYPMELDPSRGSFSVRLPVPVGSVVKYRYERQGDELRFAEHTSDGSPVRYRMLLVDGPKSTDDVISRWTDTEYTSASGRIMGTATDTTSGLPIPGLLVSAGGEQTYTNADGSFLLEGLPPGIHNLVGYSLDGSYEAFQQGAEVAADSTTPAPITLKPASLVNITFEITPPANTPPLVPLRLAGNLLQLGNTFGTLSGGVSTLATRMPILNASPDGKYTLTMQLPAGADIRYKYTLGDGYWNAEHRPDGSFRVRQIIVPAQDTTIQDTVDTWETNPGGMLTFDVTVPENTPDGDFVSIQFNPLFGWTEPIPMWSLGGNRWAYVLLSPLNLPGSLSYRYCRNNQCGYADDAATPGQFGAGKTINLEQLPQQFQESVNSWVGLDQVVDPALAPVLETTPRGENFMAGIEFIPSYHPSWLPIYPQTLQRVSKIGANWIVFDPTWSVTRANPPVFSPVAGQDALWSDVVKSIQDAHDQGLKVAVNPSLSFKSFPLPACPEEPCPSNTEYWWQDGTRDFSWWLVWFDHYRDFILHHADLAAQTNTEALIVGGEWISPALPGGLLLDGQPSGNLVDAEERWRKLIAEIRQHYSGELIWSTPYQSDGSLPPFIDAFDKVYLELSIESPAGEATEPTDDEFALQLNELLDGRIKEIQNSSGKPLVIVAKAPSNPTMEFQLTAYQALLNAVNQRDWISGLISSGYYPPAQLQDQTDSIHGKTTEPMLQNWYQGVLP